MSDIDIMEDYYKVTAERDSLRAELATLKEENGKLEVTLELRLEQVYHSENELVILKEQNALLTRQLDRLRLRNWTREMLDAWHQNIPDMNTAFDALINAAAISAQEPK